MLKLMRFLSWPVLCGILAGVIIIDHLPGLNSHRGSTDTRYNSASENPAPLSYARAVQMAAPAVVNIYTSKTIKPQLPAIFDNPLLREYLSRNGIIQKERIQRSLGSGVIMSTKGYILTNEHVIRDADEILVLLHDGREALASVIGSDQEADLAVLKIDLPQLSTLEVADPSQAMVGDVVLAIGNPYGFGQSVTQGIISATGRYGLRLSTYENFIQTDASINPGNSGGALVDAQGRLLGINTAIYSRSGGSQGIGLAIPSDLALQILSDLVKYGRVIRGWLGLEASPVPRALSQANHIAGGNGVVITAVYRDGPADQAGMRTGDIITHINGQAVGDGNAGMNFIAATRPGEQVAIALLRQGQPLRLNATVGSRPE